MRTTRGRWGCKKPRLLACVFDRARKRFVLDSTGVLFGCLDSAFYTCVYTAGYVRARTETKNAQLPIPHCLFPPSHPLIMPLHLCCLYHLLCSFHIGFFHVFTRSILCILTVTWFLLRILSYKSYIYVKINANSVLFYWDFTKKIICFSIRLNSFLRQTYVQKNVARYASVILCLSPPRVELSNDGSKAQKHPRIYTIVRG